MTGGPGPSTASLLYHPLNNTLTPLPPLTPGRFYHTIAAGPSGLLMCGGWNGSYHMDLCQEMKVGSEEWVDTDTPLPRKMNDINLVYAGGRYWQLGGHTFQARAHSINIAALTHGTWMETEMQLANDQAGHVALAVPRGMFDRYYSGEGY